VSDELVQAIEKTFTDNRDTCFLCQGAVFAVVSERIATFMENSSYMTNICCQSIPPISVGEIVADEIVGIAIKSFILGFLAATAYDLERKIPNVEGVIVPKLSPYILAETTSDFLNHPDMTSSSKTIRAYLLHQGTYWGIEFMAFGYYWAAQNKGILSFPYEGESLCDSLTHDRSIIKLHHRLRDMLDETLPCNN
jgi:hypothetical protein